MNKLISTILCCISIVSCSSSLANTAPKVSALDVAKSQTETLAKATPSPTKIPKQPQVGTVKELVNGDLLCYVTLVDETGTKYNSVGASFEICAESAKFLNKKVRASYTIESVNDCQSAEPCGKTRKESIITKMEVLEKKSSIKPKNSNSRTISNGEWTITIGNSDSWKGVNNTGNLSYKGCKIKGKCIELTDGKVSCRDGKCVTGWKNGDYIYIIEQPITEDGKASSTLIIKKGTREILKATGLK